MRVTAPSKDAWYGKDPPTSKDDGGGGYEVRLKYSADALARARNSARNEWEARTVYVVSTPRLLSFFSPFFLCASPAFPLPSHKNPPYDNPGKRAPRAPHGPGDPPLPLFPPSLSHSHSHSHSRSPFPARRHKPPATTLHTHSGDNPPPAPPRPPRGPNKMQGVRTRHLRLRSGRRAPRHRLALAPPSHHRAAPRRE